jgi:Fe-S-cluster containining protein
MHTRVLSLHADYACRRSGACCTAGWPIAVEPRVQRAVREAVTQGVLRPHLAEPFAPEAPRTPTLLALDGRGRCVFFQEGTPHACAIHSQLGHGWLPLACRQFPRVALLTPYGVSLTLSHYCPTAASLLFRDDRGLDVVADPPAFPPGGEYDGLDARETLPLLRPGVFLDWDAHRVWEEHAVATLGREDLTPEQALARLGRDADAACRWTPERGSLAAFLGHLAAAEQDEAAVHEMPFADALAAWRLAASCVPAGAPQGVPLSELALTASDADHVVPAWPVHGRTVRRYLAAKAFASWCGVQGEGLPTAMAFLQTALGVLRVEAARACGGAGRTLDAPALRQALRAADLLLVHLAEPDALARRLVLSRRQAARRLH